MARMTRRAWSSEMWSALPVVAQADVQGEVHGIGQAVARPDGSQAVDGGPWYRGSCCPILGSEEHEFHVVHPCGQKFGIRGRGLPV